MKRYRMIGMSFDFTVRHLDPSVAADWSDEAKQRWQQHMDQVKQDLAAQYGEQALEAKIHNLHDIGAQEMSVIDTHNVYYRQARHAFIVGAYYPALTATAALGERILNDLVITLRADYPVPAGLPEVRDHKTFSNWRQMIDALEEWEVLLPEVVTSFRGLSKIRGRSIHYNPISLDDMRQLAVGAIELMNTIIGRQFGTFGTQPWYIPGIRGHSFVASAWEQHPFVRAFLLPHAALIGPRHRLDHDPATGFWQVIDDDNYEDGEVTDGEFRELVDSARAER